jgi:hypothetical protein
MKPEDTIANEVRNMIMDISLLETLKDNGIEVTPRRPDGFGITVQEYMEAQGCTEVMARSVLKQSVKRGVLVVTKMVGATGGGHQDVYHRKG